MERDLGEINPGIPVQVDLTAADELVALSFPGSADQRWWIEVRDDTVAGCGPKIVVAGPSDAPVTTSACLDVSAGEAVIVPVVVTSTGMHKIRLAPGGAAGSVTLTLTEAALDRASAAAAVAAGPIVIDGPPVTINLAPNASTVVTYDWAGTNRVVLEETNCIDMTYYFSYGAGYQGRACYGGPYNFTWRTVTPRTPGTHYLEFYAGSRPATVTLQMRSRAPDVTGTLTPGGPPISVTLGEPAQAAWISFAGTQGQNLVVEASTSASLPECWAGLDTRKPDSYLIPFQRTNCFPSQRTHQLGRLPTTGTYRIELDTGLDFPEPHTATVTLRLTFRVPPVCLGQGVPPILLVHGFTGSSSDWNDVRPFFIERVEEELERAGVPAGTAVICAPDWVRAIDVGPQASSRANSSIVLQNLYDITALTAEPKADIVAHSKGGLDSRRAIRTGAKVNNLVMIATPNGGTVLADWGCGLSRAPLLLRPIAKKAVEKIWSGKCDGPEDALWGLTQDFVRDEFNPAVPDNPTVRYHTIAGASSCNMCRALGPAMGPNDGKVSVDSVQWLAERGQIVAGQFDRDHTQLRKSLEVAERAYCSLPPRGSYYGPCDVQPDTAPETVAAATPSLLHYDAFEVPASGSRQVSLPVAGAGPVKLIVASDQPQLTASVGGVALVPEPGSDGSILTGEVTSTTNLPINVANARPDIASVLVMIVGQNGSALDVRTSPGVGMPGQATQVRVVAPPGGPGSPAGLAGTAIAPDGSETGLTFAAAGSDVVASFTPNQAGLYAVTVSHDGTRRRVAFESYSVSSGGASLPGTYTESVVSEPGGLLETLNLDVNVNVTAAGYYDLSGGLAAADGTVIASTVVTGNLAVGQRQLRLSFRGPEIYGSAKNGPYHLVDLTLVRIATLTTIEAQIPATTQATASYPFNWFRPTRVLPALGPAVVEGNSGAKTARFPVTLSDPVKVPVTVHYEAFTGAGWATPPGDFDVTPGTLTFLPGETSKTITLTVKGDTLDENDETALVAFTNPTNATVGGYGVGGVTITDDDPLPVINPGFAAAVTEGDSGAKTVQIPVSLSAPSGRNVTVHYEAFTGAGWATPPGDFDVTPGTLTFLPGETSKTITLTVKGDTLDENDETALVAFTNPTNATVGGYGVGGVTITDDDPLPVINPGFAAAVTEGNSGTKTVQIPVSLSIPSGRNVTVHYEPFTGAGWATPPGDFDVTPGTLTFLPGQTSKTITLTIKGDTLDENDETALVAFTNPTNATVGGYGVGGVTITDDDP